MEALEQTIANLNEDIKELEKFISESKRPSIKSYLEAYLSNIKENKAIQEKKQKEAKEKAAEKPVVKEADKIIYTPITKYALDTSGSKVKIYLTDGFEGIKDFNQDNIKSKFGPKSFEVTIMGWKQKNFKIASNKLNKEINPEESKVKATSSSLIIYLAKKNSGDFWDALEEKKNVFDKPENDEEKSKDKDQDPTSSLMEMMKNMYQNGDPEMKKMIAEAWTKSQNDMGKQGMGGMPDMTGMK